MNLAGAVLSVVFTLVVLAGCVVGVAVLVRSFRHGARRRRVFSSGGAASETAPVASQPMDAPLVARVAAQPHAVLPPASGAGPSNSGGLADGERVLAWRYRQLLELGLDPMSAVELAASTVDLGAMRSLVGRGCPASLASQILR